MQEDRTVSFDRAKVDYKGIPDLFCDYVTVTENGQKILYYLLNDEKVEEGHGVYIVSTNLKEAIDASIPSRSHIGIIDKDAKIIAPCENSKVKVVDGKYILVVRAEPVSQSVKDAVAKRNDPSAAEKMVNAAATIKEKVNKAMGDGKFILNSLVSEGTVYSIDGKNVFGDNYYSFIGMNASSFYCATNVPEEDVKEFSFDLGKSIIPPIVQPADTEKVLPEVVEAPALDVTSVSVPKETIDAAIESVPVAPSVVPELSTNNDGSKAEEAGKVEEVPTEAKQEEDTKEVKAESQPEVKDEAKVEVQPEIKSEDESEATASHAELPDLNVEDTVEEKPEVVAEEKNEPIDLVPESSKPETTGAEDFDEKKFDGVVGAVETLMKEKQSVVDENETLKKQVEELQKANQELKAAKEKAEEDVKQLPVVMKEREHYKALSEQYGKVLSSVSSIISFNPDVDEKGAQKTKIAA